MKFPICSSILLVIWLQVTVDATGLNSLEKECVTELHLNQGVIEGLNTQPIVPENNVEFNKFMGCYWKKQGFQNQNGDVNYATLQIFFQNVLTRKYNNASRAGEVAKNVIKTCKNSATGNTHGEKAARFSNCIIRNVPKQ